MTLSAEAILEYHDALKAGGLTELLIFELVTIAARGMANRA